MTLLVAPEVVPRGTRPLDPRYSGPVAAQLLPRPSRSGPRVVPGLDTARLPPPVAALAERIGWTFAAVMVVVCVVSIIPTAGVLGVVGVVVAPATVAAFVGLWGIWRGGPVVPRWVQWTLFVTAVVATVLWSVGSWLRSPGYGTDAVAFNQAAATLLLNGRNPYGVDLSSSLDAFAVPPVFVTLTLDGATVENLSYPAGSVLILAAAMGLGLDAQAANVVDLAAWLAAMTALMVLLPRSLRWLAVALVTSNILTGFVAGGVTDPLYLLPLALALWRWDRYGTAGAGLARWIGPVALGLACSIKQLPWFFAPFLLVAIILESRRAGRSWIRAGLGYTATASAVFLAINGPFLLWDAEEFLRGALLPLTQPLVPDGQGLASLISQAGLGGGDLAALGVTGLAGYAGLLLLVLAGYDRWRTGWPVLVIAAFLLPSRSLASYLLMAMPAVMVALTTLRPPGPGEFVPPLLRRIAGVGAMVLLVIAAGAAVVVLTAKAPLDIEITDSRGTGARQTVSEVTADVTNTSDSMVLPHYTVSVGGRHSGWWEATQGDGPIAAGETRTIVLRAPGDASMPGAKSRFQITAFVADPGSVSTSRPGERDVIRLLLSPAQLPLAVPVGTPVEFTIELRDEWGRPLERGGVQVALNQIVFAPKGYLPGPASIDGEAAGASPIMRTTAPDGTLSFTVTGVAALVDPVYVQAWIADDPEHPRSFSSLTSLRFTE